jgi:hypothetical protein
VTVPKNGRRRPVRRRAETLFRAESVRRAMGRVAAPLLVATLSAARGYGEEAKPLLANGDFAAWEAGRRAAGRRAGGKSSPRPPSKIPKGPDGGVRFEGDVKTGPGARWGRRWRSGGAARTDSRLRPASRPVRRRRSSDPTYVGVRSALRARSSSWAAALRVTPGEVVFRRQREGRGALFLRGAARWTRAVHLEKSRPRRPSTCSRRTWGATTRLGHAKVD